MFDDPDLNTVWRLGREDALAMAWRGIVPTAFTIGAVVGALLGDALLG